MQAFKGRMNRATYWTAIGFVVVLYAIFTAVLKSDLRVQEVVLAFACVPRLHDIGKSGWVFLVGLAVELIGVIASFTLLSGDDLYVGLGVTTIAIACLVVWLGLIPGEAEVNRFGPAPPSGVTLKPNPQT